MKSRRSFVVAILLVAIMCIGVGFAKLSSVIDGTGTITYTPTFAITWDGATATSGKTTDVTVVEDTGETLTFNVNTDSWAVGNSVTITATVKNDLKYAAENVKVQNLTTTAVEAYYTVSVVLDGSATIEANGTRDVTITITMDKYPLVNEAGFSQDFTFKVSADQKITPQYCNINAKTVFDTKRQGGKI